MCFQSLLGKAFTYLYLPVIITCAEKLTGSQLSLPHTGINNKQRRKLKQKPISIRNHVKAARTSVKLVQWIPTVYCVIEKNSGTKAPEWNSNGVIDGENVVSGNMHSAAYCWWCFYLAFTNNWDVTGRHRGPKRKLRAGYRAPSLKRRHMLWCFFIVECCIARFLCAMRAFEVRTPSSPLGYLCAKFWFCTASIAELAHGEKSRTQSITHKLCQRNWPSLFNAPGTEALTSERFHWCYVLRFLTFFIFFSNVFASVLYRAFRLQRSNTCQRRIGKMRHVWRHRCSRMSRVTLTKLLNGLLTSLLTSSLRVN